MEEQSHYCFNCGAPIDSDVKICYNCNERFNDSTVIPNPKYKEILLGIALTLIIDIFVEILLFFIPYLTSSKLMLMIASFIYIIGFIQYLYILPLIYRLRENQLNKSNGVLLGSLIVFLANILFIKAFM